MSIRGYDRIKPVLPIHRNHCGAKISLYAEQMDESTEKNRWPHSYAEVYCDQGKRDAINVADRLCAAWNATLDLPIDVLERINFGKLVEAARLAADTTDDSDVFAELRAALGE